MPLAGLLLLVAAAAILLGITSAEALHPGPYSTHLNEISDLGAPAAPGIEAYQPSARIFNGAKLLAGASILAAAYVLYRGTSAHPLESDAFILVLALHGAGTLGVGLFPSDQRTLHLGFATLSFAAGGAAALLSAAWQGSFAPTPRYASAALGVVTLVALVLTGLGSRTALYGSLGPGGIERWIAYPIVLWLASFGGYLMRAPAD
jgi:hypothetical membrane protein